MVVDNRVIPEIKAGETLPAFASRQLVNYLRATSFQLGLLLHFGPDAKYQRFVDSQRRQFGVTSS